MQKLSEFYAWLKSLFLHPKQEKEQMTDEVVVTPASNVAAQATPSDADILLAQVKELLIKVGHNVEPVFDEVVALARKLV